MTAEDRITELRKVLLDIANLWPETKKDAPTWDGAFSEDTFDEAAEDGYNICASEVANKAREVLRKTE